MMMKRKAAWLAVFISLFLIAVAGCADTSNMGQDGADEDIAPIGAPDEANSPAAGEPAAGEELLYGEAQVANVEIQPMASDPSQVEVTVTGNLRDSCTEIGEATVERTNDTFQVTLMTQRPADIACAEVIVSYEETISLDVAELAMGQYTVNVNGETETFTLPIPAGEDESAIENEKEGYRYHNDSAYDVIPVSHVTASRATAADSFYLAKIFLVALGDDGQRGPKVGCGDSLVAVERPVPSTADSLRAALEGLFSVNESYLERAQLHSAFDSSDLQLTDVIFEKNGQAFIFLSGNHILGEPCNTARLEAQLRATALQFPAVKKVTIFIQDTAPLEETLSFF